MSDVGWHSPRRALLLALILLPGAALAQVVTAANLSPQAPSIRNSRGTALELGRSQPAYQVFAHNLALPSIAVVSNGLVIVGSSIRFVLGQTNQQPQQIKELAEQFGVPPTVLERFVEQLASQPQRADERLEQELRAVVTDCKFLLQKWGQYSPAPEGQKVKAEALRLLGAGELDVVWEMFNSLSRPAPPSGLHVGS